jgi:hypothetical protein
MAETRITKYIRQLLDNGYSMPTIRGQLTNAGYSEADIDSSINYVSSHPYPITKGKVKLQLPSKKIFLGAGAIVGIVLIVAAIFLLLPGAPKQWLKLEVSSSMSEIEQGGEFSFTNDLANAGKKKRYSIFLSHEIANANTGSVLTISTETAPLETTASHASTIKIPGDAKPGNYVLSTTAVFVGQKVTKTLSFKVTKKAEVPTCDDKIQNQGEEGIDCGGPCDPCEDGTASGSIVPGTDTGISGGALTPGAPTQVTLPPGAASLDHDGDGIPNVDDFDDDNDGILDTDDDYDYDFDNDGIPDIEDDDDDDDGVPDSIDSYPYDFDNDGISTRLGPSVQPTTSLGGPAILQCPSSCNDYDICTRDTCVSGVCQHTAISPCCGDFICEEGETSTGCPQDCAAQTPKSSKTAAEIIEEAIAKAATDPEGAALMCYQLTSVTDADECFPGVADAANETAICAQVTDDRKRDSCYMNKLLENADLSVCEKITNQIVQRTCYSLVNIRAQEQLFIDRTGMNVSIENIPGYNESGI